MTNINLLNDLSALTSVAGGGDDQLIATSNDVARLEYELVDRLRSTGSFSQHQIRLIEDELRSLASCSQVFSRVSALRPGEQIGHYVIDELLAHGGGGHVFRGHHSETLEPTAIKVLDNARMSNQFRVEMQILQQLAHPNIVTAYEVAEFEGIPYIAMELLRGPDLNTHVRDDGPLDWLVSTRYVLQASRALGHAHQRKLLHRDIKPANIILNGDDQVKLVDLGLAAIECSCDEVMERDETKDEQVAGTLPYMAPEQAKSLSAANCQSDIYSLGATWFYLLTGDSRLPGTTFTEQFQNLLLHCRFNALPTDCLPPALNSIYQCMVAYDAKDRYQNCSELSVEIEHALDNLGEATTDGTIAVLIVEDSLTDMRRTVEVLRHTNQSLSIHRAVSKCEGIQMCLGGKIDLVLLDLTLPDSFGIETLRHFRRAISDIPIVVLSGTSDEKIAAECLNCGANSFLSKIELTAQNMERIIFITLSHFTSCTAGPYLDRT